jgi:hypothetical protein
MIRKFLDVIDNVYRWIHQLEPIETIFYIGLKTYRGALLTLSDGTVVKSGDKICTLHFNNKRIALIHSESEWNTGFSFARHVTLSLSALAKRLYSDKAFERVVALNGITWMSREGAKKIGFDSYPVGGVCRLLWLRIKFSLYLFSVGKKKAARKISPHAFWMSKKRLLSQHQLD